MFPSSSVAPAQAPPWPTSDPTPRGRSVGTGDPLGRQIALTGKVLQLWASARLTEHGGSLTDWMILRRLGDEPSQRELAQRMGIEAPTLVGHLDRMESQGLVQRRRDDADRRIVRIAVTPAGLELHDHLRQVAETSDLELRQLLSPAEEQTLIAALERLRAYTVTEAADDTDR